MRLSGNQQLDIGIVCTIQVLDQRDFPYSDLKLLASSRSAGKTYDFQGTTYTCEELTEDSFSDCDIALFSAGGSVTKKFAPIASDAGCTVVDNSSAFRMTEGVPLVIPEVNADAMKGMKVRSEYSCETVSAPPWEHCFSTLVRESCIQCLPVH